MWIHIPRFFDIVRESWVTIIIGLPIHILVWKNRVTKEVLCWLNKEEVETYFVDASYFSLESNANRLKDILRPHYGGGGVSS